MAKYNFNLDSSTNSVKMQKDDMETECEQVSMSSFKHMNGARHTSMAYSKKMADGERQTNHVVMCEDKECMASYAKAEYTTKGSIEDRFNEIFAKAFAKKNS